MEEGPASDDRLLARYGRKFSPGTVVFREGEPSDVVFLLQSGRIRLFKQVGAIERSLRVVRPGDLFGELALLQGSHRQSTAVALDESLALAFDHATFHQVAQTNPDVGLRVIGQIVRRLRDAEDQIEILMVRDHQSKVVVAPMKLAQRELGVVDQSTGEVTLQISPLELSAQVGRDVEIVKRVVSRLLVTGAVRIHDDRVPLACLDALRALYSLLSIKDQLRGRPDRDRSQAFR